MTSTRPSAPLASHPAFTPILVGWCALLFGLATFVLAMAASSSFWLPALLSVVAAICGAFCGYKVAESLGAKLPKFAGFRKARSPEQDYAEEATGRRAAAFITKEELGSSSLDAPLDLDMADALEEEGFESDEAAIALEESATMDADHSADDDEPRATYYEDPFADDGFDGPASPNDRHFSDALGRKRYDFTKPMDLGRSDGEPTTYPSDDSGHAESATLPEEQPIDLNELTPQPELAVDTETAPAPIVQEDPIGFEPDGGVNEAVEIEAEGEPEMMAGAVEADAPLHQAQIIDLKDRELKDLSLVQMVDRFAVGLEGHRKARANDPSSRAVRPSDPRIAKAIRDLPISDLRSTGDNATRAQAEQTEAALREALEKLQQMSDHG
ncbi:MAG: DUF308 domain-containing protein [Erythrobacter sp.]